MGMPYYVGYGWLFSNWLCHDCVSSVCSPCQCPVSYSRNQSKSIRLTSAPPPGIKYGFIEFKMSKNTDDNNTNDNNDNNDSTSDDDSDKNNNSSSNTTTDLHNNNKNNTNAISHNNTTTSIRCYYS